MLDPVGQTLGHCRIVEKIGAGGMGEVHRAHDERLDRAASWFLLSFMICACATSVLAQNCPELVGVWSDHPVREVTAYGNFAYVGNGAGFFIVDVSDPSLPQQRGELPYPGDVRDIEVSGDHAFVAEHDGPPGVRGLNVVDVSDPWAPEEVGFYSTFASPYGVALADGYAYVLDGDGGIPFLHLRVVNVRTPSNPWEEGTLSGLGYGEDIDYSNGYAYVGWGLRVVDVSDPTQPYLVAKYITAGPSNRVFVSGSLAYLVGGCYEGHDLWVIDVSDPSSPVEAGFFSFGDGRPADIAVSGRYAYAPVAPFAAASSLRVIDISTPSEPVEVGFSESGASQCSQVAVSGDLVFAAGLAGMEIYDVSACEDILLVDGFDWGSTARWSSTVP